MAAPTPTHFWHQHTSANLMILRLAGVGEAYNHEDPVWHAWSAILPLYFPANATTPQQEIYSIQREAYRGPASAPHTVKPDHVVIKLLRPVNPQPAPNNPQVPQISSRDVLWIECKPPSHDTPSQWKDLICQAAARLDSAHPTRVVYLIVAVGLKWMFFKWDPSHASPLQVLAHNQNTAWTVPYAQLCFDPAVAGQRHVLVNNTTGVQDIVDPRRAYTLDFWTLGQSNQPRNASDLLLLVRCFAHVQATNFQGDNPAHFL